MVRESSSMARKKLGLAPGQAVSNIISTMTGRGKRITFAAAVASNTAPQAIMDRKLLATAMLASAVPGSSIGCSGSGDVGRDRC